jgi:hypothetical protein
MTPPFLLPHECIPRQVMGCFYHCRDLGRIFGQEFLGKKIDDLDYAQLPTFSSQLVESAAEVPPAHIRPHRPCCVADGPLTIPLLEDVFREFADLPIQIDIKSPGPGLVEATLGLINQYPGRRGKVLIGSFSRQVNDQIYRTDPGLPLFASTWRMLFLLACYYVGCLQAVHIYESGVSSSHLFCCVSRDQSNTPSQIYNTITQSDPVPPRAYVKKWVVFHLPD